MRKILTLCIAVIAALSAQARHHDLQQFEVDSISTALATLCFEPIQKKMASMTLDQKAAFRKGLSLALDSARTNDPYVQGLEEGTVIYRRVQQAEQIGGFTVDMPQFRKYIIYAFEGKSTGFTVAEADSFLTDLNTRIIAADSPKISKSDRKKATQALASLWADYLSAKVSTEQPAILAAYRSGLTTALQYARDNDYVLDGIEAGTKAYSTFLQQQKVGEYDLSIIRFNLAIDKMLNGRSSGFTPQTASGYLHAIHQQLSYFDRILDNSDAFLDSVAALEGIIRLPYGTMVQIVTEGEGDSPGPDDLVLVNYSGRLIDGTVFNTSDPENPSVFAMPELIAGFRDGLTQMKKGGKYTIFIPADQGYGSDGVYGLIPKNAVTIFDVELLDFRHMAPTEPTPAQ